MGKHSALDRERRDQAIYDLRIAHPDWGHTRMARRLHVPERTLRGVLLRMVREGRLLTNKAQPSSANTRIWVVRDTTNDKDVITSFYFGQGQRNKEVTARKFGVTHYTISRALALSGHPEECSPSVLKRLKMDKTEAGGIVESDKPSQPSLDYIREHWRGFIHSLRGEGSSGNLDAFLRSACDPIALEDDTLVLGFYYPYHKEKIESTPYRESIEQGLLQTFGQPYHIRCVLVESESQVVSSIPQPSTEGNGNDLLDQILSRLQKYKYLKAECEHLKLEYATACSELQVVGVLLNEKTREYEGLQLQYDEVFEQYKKLRTTYVALQEVMSQPD
jgi:hypothetical protein